ncbi:MAG TPA: hypothetical protein VH157_13505 [Bryobacteraceae bacterium]|jgi:hypothetical protein|nr:hypothetical protein [Bryobacteraceae bacterium]
MLGTGRKAVIPLLFVCTSLGARDYGPRVGSKMPAFDLRDQDGKAHTLASLLGPKGAVIVFFRSADW